MTDYIEREAVREALHNPMLMGMGFTEWELDRIPMADAEKVRHGKWEVIETECYAEWCRCSVCGERDRHPRGVSLPYCCHCGAKMAEEKVDMEEDDG